MAVHTVYIYALSHPETGEIRYIGKANDIQKRLQSHIRDAYRRSYPVYMWMRKILSAGKVPDIILLETTDSDKWQYVEKRIIEEYASNGCHLLNVASGGDEPYCSIEQRRLNGAQVARIVHDNPKSKKVWQLKKTITESLRFFKQYGMNDIYNKNVARLHEIARLNPLIFGNFSKLHFL